MPAGVAAAIGTGVVGAGLGAALGAGEGLVTHGNVGKDALFGGITGGVLGGFGGELGSLTGSAIGGDVLAGGIGGALGGAATGGNVLEDAALGAAGGGVSGALSGASLTSGPSAGAGGGGGASAIGTAAPPGVDVLGPTDVTSGLVNAGAAPGAASAPIPGSTGLAAPSGDILGPTDVLSGLGTTGGDALSTANAPLPGAVGTGAAAPGVSSTAGLPTGALTPANPLAGSLASPAGGVTNNAVTASESFGSPSLDLGVTGGAASPTTGASGGPIVNASPSLTGGSSSGGLGGMLKNPIVDLAGAGLALDVLRGNQQPPEFGALSAEAAAATAQGKQFENYLASGTLPPGLQAGVNAATASAQATIRSQYAARGQSGSSAEAQDLQNVQNQMVTQAASIANTLFQEGMSETEIGNQIYSELMDVQMQEDAQLSQGISGLVGALAMASRPISASASVGG